MPFLKFYFLYCLALSLAVAWLWAGYSRRVPPWNMVAASLHFSVSYDNLCCQNAGVCRARLCAKAKRLLNAGEGLVVVVLVIWRSFSPRNSSDPTSTMKLLVNIVFMPGVKYCSKDIGRDVRHNPCTGIILGINNVSSRCQIF